MDYRSNPAPLQPDRSILVAGMHGHVYGIDRATGAVRWQNLLARGGVNVVHIGVGYGAVVASAYGAMIFCLDYLTGRTRWSSPTHGSGRATIVIEPDHIVCAKSGHIDCFSPDGIVLWSRSLGGAEAQIALGYPGNVAQADDV